MTLEEHIQALITQYQKLQHRHKMRADNAYYQFQGDAQRLLLQAVLPGVRQKAARQADDCVVGKAQDRDPHPVPKKGRKSGSAHQERREAGCRVSGRLPGSGCRRLELRAVYASESKQKTRRYYQYRRVEKKG